MNYHVTCRIDCGLFWIRTEQLSVHETRQEKEADGGGLQQSSALEQGGGELLWGPNRSVRRDVNALQLLYRPCLRQAVCGYGAQDALPFCPAKEGELFFIEDRDINLVELALATNIPKGCAETMVRGRRPGTVRLFTQVPRMPNSKVSFY